VARVGGNLTRVRRRKGGGKEEDRGGRGEIEEVDIGKEIERV